VYSPGPNASGGPQFSLMPFHARSGLFFGRITGAQIPTPEQEHLLFENSLYVNIRSHAYGRGELRGQLIIVPEPSSADLLGLGAIAVAPLRRRWS